MAEKILKTLEFEQKLAKYLLRGGAAKLRGKPVIIPGCHNNNTRVPQNLIQEKGRQPYLGAKVHQYFQILLLRTLLSQK